MLFPTFMHKSLVVSDMNSFLWFCLQGQYTVVCLFVKTKKPYGVVWLPVPVAFSREKHPSEGFALFCQLVAAGETGIQRSGNPAVRLSSYLKNRCSQGSTS